MASHPLSDRRVAEWIRVAEDAWNERNLDALLLGSTIDCQWRIRTEFLWGREQVRNFLLRRWRGEMESRMVSEGWTFGDRRIALRFASECRDDNGSWFRSFGNEIWGLDPSGLVRQRFISVNGHPIREPERLLAWPLGRRPVDHPTLSELGM